MKKISLIVLSAIVWFCLSSCDKAKQQLDQLGEFDMPYSTTVTVPATTVAVTTPVDVTSSDIATNSSSTFSQQKTVSDKISEIKLTKMNLTTNTGNFNYLKTLTVYIQGTGLPEVQIATKANVPDGLTSLDLDLSDTNLKGYITGTTFKLRINVTADGINPADQVITLNETMHVKATLTN